MDVDVDDLALRMEVFIARGDTLIEYLDDEAFDRELQRNEMEAHGDWP